MSGYYIMEQYRHALTSLVLNLGPFPKSFSQDTRQRALERSNEGREENGPE